MAWSEYVVTVGSPTNPAGNQAQVTFHYAGASAGVEQGLAMLSAAFITGSNQLADGSYIAGVTYRTNSMAGALDIPWSSSAYGAIRTYRSSVPDISGYGDTFGSGDPFMLGGSMLVLERTSLPGRSFTGRKYLPNVSRLAVGSDGLFGTSVKTYVDGAYSDLLLTYCLTTFSTTPVVRSTKLNTEHAVLAPSTQLLPARLRSRQR